MSDLLEIRYIPLSKAIEWEWEENAKEHDIGGMIQAIRKYGFTSPAKYDATLDALVFGNGRTRALQLMYEDFPDEVPRGIAVDKETGEWAIPVIFGVDSESQAAARAAAIDHNNLQLTGGDLSLFDIKRLYDPDKYMNLLDSALFDGFMPVTVDEDDLFALRGAQEQSDEEEQAQEEIAALDPNDVPVSAGDLDEPDNDREYRTIHANVSIRLYGIYLRITEEFGDTDDERLEGWLEQYREAEKEADYDDAYAD